MDIGSSLAIGIGAAAAGSLLVSGGTILQALDVRRMQATDHLHVSLLIRLLRRPLWLGGTVLGYLAFPFQLLALAKAPLVVVQPVHVLGLLLLMVGGCLLLTERLSAREVSGVAALIVGLVVLTWGAPTGPNPPVSQSAMVAAVVGPLVMAALPYLVGRHEQKLPLILSAALGFAATNLAVKAFSEQLAAGHLLPMAGYLAAAGAGSVVGVVSQMTAFQRYRAADVVPLTFTVPIFLPALVGLVVLRQHWHTAALGGLPFAIGVGVLLAGTAAVARSTAVVELSAEAANRV